ncbi:MAG: DNA polymerase IV [Planctomycetaceae bacterium]|nr:DNA polymerase IV [Planctomycetaceae bacterium]
MSSPALERSILHVDMDAFYASIEQRERPELRNCPVVVGGSPQGRGVVAAASYEAREFGVYSAMPASRAYRLCPQAIFVKPRIAFYAEIGQQVRDILGTFTPLVEPLSLDEAFLDVTGTEKLHGSAIEIGRSIKQRIFEELQLVASVGIAPNKFLAKIASDHDKPDGFTIVPPDRIAEFLDPLPIRRLWGVGKQSESRLQAFGVETIGDLKRFPIDTLTSTFGEKMGRHLFRLCLGEDKRAVIPDHEAVSISHETTFAEDISDREILRAVLQQLTDQVARRLRRQAAKAGTVQLKIRYENFQTYTRSVSLPVPTDLTRELWEAVRGLFETRLPDRPLTVRLLGMGVTHLHRGKTHQTLLFGNSELKRDRQLDSVRDKIVKKFGVQGLQPGTGLNPSRDTRSGPYGQES